MVRRRTTVERSRTTARRSELSPSLAVAYNNRAYELEAMGELEQAVAYYRLALRLAPSLPAVIRPNLQRLGAEP